MCKDEDDDDISGGNRVDSGKKTREKRSVGTDFSDIHTGLHFVYRRKDNSEHSGDYGKKSF